MLCSVIIRGRECLAQGEKNQAELFGGGKQCTCAALVFLCMESSCNISRSAVNSTTVDDLLVDGTTLYSRHFGTATTRYLMISELPTSLTLRGRRYTVNVLDPIYTGLTGMQITDADSLSFALADAVRDVFNVARCSFLTLGHSECAYTSAICKTDNYFAVFDSHSRNELGTCSTTGKSIILKVASVEDLIAYIIELAESLYAGKQTVPFELTPVGICGHDDVPKQEGDPGENVGALDTAIDNANVARPGTSSAAANEMLVDHGEQISSGSSDEDEESDLVPSVCTGRQYKCWQEKRSWLKSKRLDTDVVGIACATCSEIGSLTACNSTKEKIGISPEWLQGVTAKNSKKLNDKLLQHERTTAHLNCIKELKIRASEKIKSSLNKSGNIWQLQNEAKIEITSRTFRTAYLVAWKHLSFSAHRHIYKLQQQNGLEMGKMLFSDVSCRNIINFISSEMRDRLIKNILSSDEPFSLMMDESTTQSNLTVLILYMRAINPQGE